MDYYIVVLTIRPTDPRAHTAWLLEITPTNYCWQPKNHKQTGNNTERHPERQKAQTERRTAQKMDEDGEG